MKQIRLNLIIFFFVFSLLGLKAQPYGILNLAINPTNPNTTSQVKAIANSLFASYPCTFKGSTVTINNDTIKVIVKRQVGFFFTLCNATDTVTIGQLPVGNYTLLFHLMDFSTNFTYDIDTLNFNINIPTGLSSHSKTNDPFNIYPNPTKDKLTIEFENKNAINFLLTNSLGQPIPVNAKTINSQLEIDTSELPLGIYYLKVQNSSGQRVFKVIKDSTL